MRIATWNVNSLKARQERLEWWLERAEPDVLLMQETKLSAKESAIEWLDKRGYSLVSNGEGGRNGVAIASKVGLESPVVYAGKESRMVSAICDGIFFLNIYAPNGRTLGSPTYLEKLAWYAELEQWLATRALDEPLVLGGDFNITPEDRDVWDRTKAHGGTHVSEPERAILQRLLGWGLVDSYRKHQQTGERYTWWDYRAGDFYKNFGMRIDLLLVTPTVAARSVFAEIDREARKGKPTPSDHAPYVLDLDTPGKAFESGWAEAEERIALRRKGKRLD